MGKLIDKEEQGNWALKGVSWQQLRAGQTITQNTAERLYGALAKLKDYEESGLTPEQCAAAGEEE